MASVVVVFGAAVRPDGSPSGTLTRRVRSAWLFGRARPDVQYLVTGGIGGSGYPEWQVMQRLLLEAGVPPQQIIAEREGTDTLGQIRKCVTILAKRDFADSIWIATSRYHQMRCWLLFRMMGIKARIAPALPDRHDLHLAKLLFFWAREILAVPYDVFLSFLP
jgi:vancomycin permeability regulator SanA